MTISTLRDEKFAKEYEVTFEVDSIQQAQEKWLKDNAAKIQIDGFRPGKAPMRVLLSNYGSQAKEKALNIMLENQHQSFCNTNKIKDKDLVKIEPVSDTTYKFLYEVPPQFDLVDPKSMTVENLIYTPSDKEVDDFLEQMQYEMGETVEYKKDDNHDIQDDDIVAYDIVFSENGVVIESDADLLKEIQIAKGPELEVHAVYDMLVDNLKGKKIGDTVDVKGFSPSGLADLWSFLNDKIVDVSITVKEVSCIRPREINDELFKDLHVENLEKFKQFIRDALAMKKLSVIQTCHKRYVFDALDAAYNFDVSEEKVETEFNRIWNEFLAEEKEFKKKNQEHPDTVGKTLEEVKTEYQNVAKRRIRLTYIIDKAREEYKLNLTQKDVVDYGRYFFEIHSVRSLEFWSWRMMNDEAYRKEQLLIIHENKIAQFLHSQATHKDIHVTEDELDQRIRAIIPA